MEEIHGRINSPTAFGEAVAACDEDSYRNFRVSIEVYVQMLDVNLTSVRPSYKRMRFLAIH